MKLKCVAVDYDECSLATIANYMSNLPNFKPLITFTDPMTVLMSIIDMQDIDLLFIDIELLNIVEKEFTSFLRQKIKRLIVTSTDRNNAFQAFEFNADAFLLKPYSFSNFLNTINRLFQKGLSLGRRETDNNFFFIKSKNEKFNLIKIKPSEIVAIESLQNYVAIQTLNKKVIAHLTLSRIKEILTEQRHIIQVHRSFLISKKYIEEIESNIIKMSGNIHIAVGENYKGELLAYLKENTIQTGRNANYSQ